MPEDKQDSDPGQPLPARRRGGWDKLGDIHEEAVIQEAPSRLVLSGVAAEPQRKGLQAQLLHQPAHPGRRSPRCEPELHSGFDTLLPQTWKTGLLLCRSGRKSTRQQLSL